MRVNVTVGIILLGLAGAVTPGRSQVLHVAAAANLQTALNKAFIPAFERATGAKVSPTFGSTKLLAVQIEQGAPVDVFVAADKSTVDDLAKKKLVVGATERVYAVGRLVLWSRKDAKLHPRSVAALVDSRYSHIALANPMLAPYGKAALEAIEKAKLVDKLKSRIVMAENIAQALEYARSGNADTAFTALSLVIDDKIDPYFIVPNSFHAPISQAVAAVRSSSQPKLSRRFIEFLTGRKARLIWKRYGYEMP